MKLLKKLKEKHDKFRIKRLDEFCKDALGDGYNEKIKIECDNETPTVWEFELDGWSIRLTCTWYGKVRFTMLNIEPRGVYAIFANW